MSSEETVFVQTHVVGCDGGRGALGHPLVFLNLGDEGEAVCPYCSRHYVLAKDAPAAAH